MWVETTRATQSASRAHCRHDGAEPQMTCVPTRLLGRMDCAPVNSLGWTFFRQSLSGRETLTSPASSTPFRTSHSRSDFFGRERHPRPFTRCQPNEALPWNEVHPESDAALGVLASRRTSDSSQSSRGCGASRSRSHGVCDRPSWAFPLHERHRCGQWDRCDVYLYTLRSEAAE